MDENLLPKAGFWYTRLSETIIRNLYILAWTPFCLTAFSSRWQSFGWVYTPRADDEFGFWVEVDSKLRLMVQLDGDRIDSAWLPFCYWEDYEPDYHPTLASYRAERRMYDTIYEQVFQQTQAILGEAHHVGQDKDDDAHRYSVWRSEHALLILQQAEFDVQFGFEINFWLEPYFEENFAPTTPLINWLEKRRHSKFSATDE